MQKYELCILILTICVTGVAFKIKISDFHFLKNLKAKSIKIEFDSYFFPKLLVKSKKKRKQNHKSILTRIVEYNRILQPLPLNKVEDSDV